MLGAQLSNCTPLMFVIVMFCLTRISSAEKCDPLEEINGLNVFNCSGKEIQTLPTLPPEAQILDFSNNNFSSLSPVKESAKCTKCGPEAEQNQCRLSLYLTNNKITKIEGEPFADLKCLKVLDLSYNKITGDSLHSTTFEDGLYYVERLILRGNPLEKLPDNVITSPFFPFLLVLDLSHCELKELGKLSVDDLKELRYLDLGDNQLVDIHQDTFKGLKKLETLKLTNNRLTYFSEHVFGDLVNLKELVLSGNKIQDFHTNSFYDDCPLKNLDLSDNLLDTMPYNAVDKLRNLETLDLSENPMQRVTASSKPSRVQNLVMDRMPELEKVQTGDLASFPGLVSLSISDSKAFKKFEAGALGSEALFLRHVRFENTWLTTLDKDALPWEQLHTLRLGGNPWLCDDRLQWMIEATCIKEPVICTAPGNLRGQDIKSLTASQLKREVPVAPVAAFVVFLLAIPIVSICTVFIWRRRRFCHCRKGQLKGRYISVFTRDTTDGNDAEVDIQIKTNLKRISTVSNGSADDTKHLVTIETNGTTTATVVDDDEEEI